MDNKYISELLEKRKRLRNFIKIPYQYEKIDEDLEEKVINAKSQLIIIQKEIDKYSTSNHHNSIHSLNRLQKFLEQYKSESIGK